MQRRYGDAEPLLLSSPAAIESARGVGDPLTRAWRRRVMDMCTRWQRSTDAARFQDAR